MTVIKSPEFISKQEITASADRLLSQMSNSKLTLGWPQLADLAADFLDLSILWEKFEPAEDDVAAKICPCTREIYINENCPLIMDSSGFYQSTLAHEIGHWLLHVNPDNVDIDEGANIFLCRKKRTPDDWREWQAQYFASCLLMPVTKIEEVRQGRILTNQHHLKAIADELGVTFSNLCNRLQDLKYIQKVDNSNRIYPGEKLKSFNRT